MNAQPSELPYSVLPRLLPLIIRIAGLGPEETVDANTGILGSGLGLDSVAALKLMLRVEKEFGVILDPCAIGEERALDTVGAFASFIQSRMECSGDAV